MPPFAATDDRLDHMWCNAERLSEALAHTARHALEASCTTPSHIHLVDIADEADLQLSQLYGPNAASPFEIARMLLLPTFRATPYPCDRQRSSP